MKKLISLLLALTMIISCGAALAAPDGKITIWCWDPAFNIASMKEAAKFFAVDHPDVEVVIEEIQFTDIETKILTAVTAGDISSIPDIYLNQDNSFQRSLTNFPEAIMDLTDKFDFEGFPAGKLGYSIVDGKNYGIPFDAGTVIGAYRTDFLAECGYTIEDLTDITWTRFLEIGRDIKAKTGKAMLSGQAGEVDTILMALQSCGSSMFNEDGSVNLVNNEALKNFIDVYVTMLKEGIFIELNGWDEYVGTFVNESVVGTVNGCWILGSVMVSADQAGKWAITNMPKLDGIEGATNYSNNGGSSWVITNNADTELALDFMKAYRNVEFYNNILPTTSAIGTWAGALEGSNYQAGNAFFNNEPIFAKILEYTAYVPSNVTGVYYYDARTALATAVTNIVNGGDVASELENAEMTVNFDMGL